LIILGGTLWIMHHLNYHMMPKQNSLTPSKEFQVE
jgi:hypothetical protein